MKGQLVCLALDGWEDHQHMESLGVTARTLTWRARPYLVSWARQFVRQTADNLFVQLKEVVQYLIGIGCVVVAAIADNAANVQLALAKLALDKVIPLHCLAHSGELLCKDVWTLWPVLEERAGALESFLRNHHYPRACYHEEVARNKDRATMLTHPCDTRWGTRAAMLESIVANREFVENTLSRLRREKFIDNNGVFQSLGWVWNGHIWDEFAQLSKLMTHVSSLVGELQGDGCTLGWALEKYIALRGHIEEITGDLTANDARIHDRFYSFPKE